MPRRGVCLGGVSTQGGVCLGVSAQGCLPMGGVCPGECLADTTPSPVDRMTDTCEILPCNFATMLRTVTRMHSNMMHNTHTLPYGGLPDRNPPGQRPPPDRSPWTETPPSVNRLTDRCENITLPQLRCGPLKKTMLNDINIK